MMKYSGIVLATTASVVVLHGCGEKDQTEEEKAVDKVYTDAIPAMEEAAKNAKAKFAEIKEDTTNNKKTEIKAAAKKFCDEAKKKVDDDVKKAKEAKKETSFVQGKDEKKEKKDETKETPEAKFTKAFGKCLSDAGHEMEGVGTK